MDKISLFQNEKYLVDAVIQESIKETFTSLSLLCDDLLSKAEKETRTREECIAYLKGAAFIFYKVCKREDSNKSLSSHSTINSPEDAVEYIARIFPFMSEGEQQEHYKLACWLNKLLELEGKDKVELPKFKKS